MEVTLPADLREQVQKEVVEGHFRSTDELIERALRLLFEKQQREEGRREALRRLGQMVDEAGLYEKVLVPDQE
ncbi:MAG TPA: hypothetical protein VE621_18075 [Bryobacteraceae bacterium]|nr:hypothetical protein [Bryobacteraceae bacterium]